MFENNESATQNADVAFQLRAIGLQLELLSRTYKDLKDEVNSIKQQNRGADRRGNTVRMAVRNDMILKSLLTKTQTRVKMTMILHLLAKESGLDQTGLGGM
jgi:hypothetical protein